MRRLCVIAVCLALAACTTTSVRSASTSGQKPPEAAKILLVNPDIDLSLLTATGLAEPRADWSDQAEAHVGASLTTSLSGKMHNLATLNPDDAQAGRAGQMLRLHRQVSASIQGLGSFLPTKKTFDWTLGDGAAALAQSGQADYALFVSGGGTYASSGRIATAVVMSMVGAAVPLGQQNLSASLVDLRTGSIVWYNTVYAGPDADMRDAAGAEKLTIALLKDIPL